MDLKSLRDVFNEQLKDMYSAEKQLAELLPELAKAASSPELKQAFEQHLQVTEGHVEIIQNLLSQMGVNPGNKKCEAMEGLTKEARSMCKEKGDKDARDAGLIAAAQKTEHYEIATYGSLRTWATVLGETEASDTLQEVLDDEYTANTLLTEIAESYVNQRAQE